jgi:hypothetical protein
MENTPTMEKLVTMNDNDNIDCSDCRRKKCPQCELGKPCPTCEISMESLCFAFCNKPDPDFEIKESNTDQWIDILRWLELYPTVKCMKERKSQKSLDYFPGFCKQHCRAFADINQQWNNLTEAEQDILLYMMIPEKCDMSYFLDLLKQPEYQHISKTRIWQLLFSPMGILCIPTTYFSMWLAFDIAELACNYATTGIKFLQQENPANHKNVLISIIESYVQMTQTAHYAFLLQYIAQPDTIRWLMSADSALRVMNWNMLNYKLTFMFHQLVAPEYNPMISRFHENWSEYWQKEAVQHFGDLLYQPVFQNAWKNLLQAMHVTAISFNRMIDLPNKQPFDFSDKFCDN